MLYHGRDGYMGVMDTMTSQNAGIDYVGGV